MTLQIGIPFAQMTNFGFQVNFKQFVLLWYLSILSIINKFYWLFCDKLLGDNFVSKWVQMIWIKSSNEPRIVVLNFDMNVLKSS
jgi:hypothetical protein